MSNVIGFLEAMGRNPMLRHASAGDVELALVGARIDPELRAAILSKDQNRIEALLGATTNVCCAQDPGKEDEDEPEQEDDKIGSQARGIAAAA